MMNKALLYVAVKKLSLSEEEAKNNHKYVSEIDAWYFWSTARGGKAMLINTKGEYLMASSAISFEKHVEEFEHGRRNN